MIDPAYRGPMRFRVTCDVTIEVENVWALPEAINERFPGWSLEDFGDPTAALQMLIDPSLLALGVPGGAFVSGEVGAEPLDPPPLG